MSNAPDLFASALGSGRGNDSGRTDLAQGLLTDAAREELRHRVERAASDVTLADTARLLRAYPDIENWPVANVPSLIRELDHDLGVALADIVIERNRDAALELLYRTGARWPQPERIVALTRGGKLHLCSRVTHPSPEFGFASTSMTACGRAITAPLKVSVARGMWAEHAHMRCERCESYQHEDAYQSECSESADDWLPDWAYNWLRTRLNTALTRTLRDPDQPLDSQALHAAFDECFRETLEQTAFEVFAEEPNLTLQRGLGLRHYRALSDAFARADRPDALPSEMRPVEATLRAPEELFAEHYRWVAANPDATLDLCQGRLFDRLISQPRPGCTLQAALRT